MQNTCYNSIEEMEIDYLRISSLNNLLQTKEEFNTFLNIPSTKQDLQCFLEVCEQEEKYEYCILINNKIKEI